MPDESQSRGIAGRARRPRGVAGKLPNEQPKGRPPRHGRPRETIMTPETQHARVGYRRPPVRGPDGATTTRSGARAAEAARTRQWGAAAQPSHASPRPEAAAKRVAEDTSIVRVIPLLAVLVVTVAGVYIAW